jgi:hypothetical protein
MLNKNSKLDLPLAIDPNANRVNDMPKPLGKQKKAVRKRNRGLGEPTHLRVSTSGILRRDCPLACHHSPRLPPTNIPLETKSNRSI